MIIDDLRYVALGEGRPEPQTVDDLKADSEYLAQAYRRVKAFFAAYDALAPTAEQWAAVPAWAQWYAIGADGWAKFLQNEPVPLGGDWRAKGMSKNAGRVHVADGIDLRTCKFQRPAQEAADA